MVRGRGGYSGSLLGFGMAQMVSTAVWPIAILGSASLGAGLAWPGHRLWRAAVASDFHAMAAVVAGVIILPFQPSFAPILTIGGAPLIAYRYGARYKRSHRGGWACRGRSTSWPALLSLSQPLWHFRGRSAGRIERLVAAGGWTTASTRRYSRWQGARR
jgi:hypothetical protein